jgi:hypothetical protein
MPCKGTSGCENGSPGQPRCEGQAGLRVGIHSKDLQRLIRHLDLKADVKRLVKSFRVVAQVSREVATASSRCAVPPGLGLNLIKPGTDVRGYRLSRPCGTGSLPLPLIALSAVDQARLSPWVRLPARLRRFRRTFRVESRPAATQSRRTCGQIGTFLRVLRPVAPD